MCGEALARILVFLFNFCFVLVGVTLLTLGIIYTINFSDFVETIPDNYKIVQHVPIIAIVVGSIIFVIAFLGCCGTLKSNTCMLTTYASILFVIFILQVSLGIFGLLKIKNADELKNAIYKQTIIFFNNSSHSPEIYATIDIIQKNLKCCGSSGPASYDDIPSSCYDNPAEKLGLYKDSCASKIFETLTNSVRIIAIVALVISTTEIIAAFLALYLANTIKGKFRRTNY
ncbi:23 kDa integral membrane protein-like [Euwallacea fornicatus]|uniref:23 kDa integral membrane protein-like n=1 Tax=Euwallacea fornicatus TaxID=995702 RepID=UPI00338D8348